MDVKNLKEIIKAIDESGLTYADIELEGMKIVLKKEAITTKVIETKTVSEPVIQPQLNVAPQKVIEEVRPSVIEKDDKLFYVEAPIVGTFYASPAPGKEPFVKVGSKVKKGDILCIIEAMKIMNEIESEIDGEIVEICVKNEQMIEFGQVLFKIKKI